MSLKKGFLVQTATGSYIQNLTDTRRFWLNENGSPFQTHSSKKFNQPKMKVSDLQPGVWFKQIGKRKYRLLLTITELKKHDHIAPLGRKFVLMCTDCKQMVLLGDKEVNIKPIIPSHSICKPNI